jgi:hypothetical protein
VTRIEVTRHVAADPASVALLLSEPSTENDPEDAWMMSPPRRTGVGFTSATQTSALSSFTASGRVIIVPAPDAGCDVRLVAAVSDEVATVRAQRSATRFLTLLARRAKARSFAA